MNNIVANGDDSKSISFVFVSLIFDVNFVLDLLSVVVLIFGISYNN